MKIKRPLATFTLTFLSVGAIAQDAPSKNVLATATMLSNIYLVEPIPKKANSAVSAWLYTLSSPNFFFDQNTLDLNLRDNATKFCNGGKWEKLHQKRNNHYLEFSFACYDQKAEIYKNAAIAQNIPKVSLTIK